MTPPTQSSVGSGGRRPLAYSGEDRRRDTPKVRRWFMTRRRSDVAEITGSIDAWRAGVVDLRQWKTDHPKRLEIAAALAMLVLGALLNWPGNAASDALDLTEDMRFLFELVI